MSTENLQTSGNDGGLSSGAVAAIVISILIALALTAVAGFLMYRKLREHRRSRGEYRPQFEEYHHAKNLPYLQPPAIEGLI